MTDLKRLRVSLTKHGAHKISELIKHFPIEQVLQNTWDKYNSIKIDFPQSRSNLSADKNGVLPPIWKEVKQLGGEYVDDLVMLAIIFSHYELIKVMINGSTGKFKGKVKRDQLDNEKSYTNFANNFEEVGLIRDHSSKEFTFDLSRIPKKFDLVPLFIQLLTLKLKTARWNGANDFLDECIALEFHRVFGLSEQEFRDWLEEGKIEKTEFEEKAEHVPEEPAVEEMTFSSGHVERSEADVVIEKAKSKLKSTLLHNKIQNKLFVYLNGLFPGMIGTEIDSGIGTTVDVVRKDGGHLIFYEIKTEKSVRLCIRQALSQLIEYCCWPDKVRAKQLIIVSQNPITEQAKKYIKHIRKTYSLPVHYQQFDLDKEELAEMI